MASETEAEFSKNQSKINELTQLPPDTLAKQMTESGLTHAGPSIAPMVSTTALNGLQYLNSKLPRPAAEFMGDDPWEPNHSAMERYNSHHDIVHDPVSVLHHVKEGTLTDDHMDALRQVYPRLLQHMQEEVASHTSPKSIKDMPYATKRSVAKFIGQPLEASMLPQTMLANQAVFAAMPNGPQQPQGKPKRGGGGKSLSKLELGKRAQTATQGLEVEED